MVQRIFLIFGVIEMVLYHSTQTTCPGKVWFSSYGLKSSRPIRSLNYFFRLWQRMALRNFLNFYMMIVKMILYHHVEIACPGSLVLKLWPKKLSANQTAWLLFQTLTENNSNEFSEFLHDDSGDDSLPSCTNCMFRKILVLELWPKRLLTNQIAWLLFQTLTKSDVKKFSEFLHNDSRDDSLPSCTNCMPRKTLVLELWPKKLLANHITWLPF